MVCQGCEEKEAEITNLLHKLIAWEADYVHKDKIHGERPCDQCDAAARHYLCTYHGSMIQQQIQAARLEAARRVRDAIGYGLQCAAKKATCEAGEEVLRIFTDDELARIIGDAPAGEVMPSVPTDHPVRDSSRSGDHVAVGEEALQREDAPAVIREMTDKVPVSGQPSAGCGTAEPPRPSLHVQPGAWPHCCSACFGDGQQAERARAVALVRRLLGQIELDCEAIGSVPMSIGIVGEARAYLAEGDSNV